MTCALGLTYLWRAVSAPASAPASAHVSSGSGADTRWLGVDHWAFLPQPGPWVFAALAVLAGAAVARWPGRARAAVVAFGALLDRAPAARPGVAALSVPVFWLASSRQENLDGSLLQQKFAAALASGHAFVTHDEMLELYLHCRLWELLRDTWGWDVAQTYRLTSCLAGGVAVYLALGLRRRFPAGRWPLVVAGLFAGGWVLVFFGDVENYTLTNVLVLGYLTAGLRYLDRPGARLWPVAVTLGTAVLFHLEALDLAPSLLVLAYLAWRRGARADAVAALLAAPLLLAGALYWFNGHGLPIDNLLTHSQAGANGGHYGAMLAPPSAHYLWAQLQLLLLLAPAVVLLPSLLGRAARPRDRYARFLGVAAVGPLLMVVLWKAQLGQYADWDLYAIVAQPVALFVFSALAAQPRIDRQAPWLVAALTLMATQALSWVAQHQVPPVG